MAIQIQLRRGTTSEWSSANPTLAIGEVGLDTTLGYFKVGTGSTAWNSLGYSNVPIPSQTSNSGKYLTTNGTSLSWATVDALPSQTGNAGKYLTTDGSTASWATVVTDPTQDIFMMMGA